jgi:hypothetical protein
MAVEMAVTGLQFTVTAVGLPSLVLWLISPSRGKRDGQESRDCEQCNETERPASWGARPAVISGRPQRAGLPEGFDGESACISRAQVSVWGLESTPARA